MHLIHVDRRFSSVIIFALYVVCIAILPIVTSVESVASIVWMAQMMTKCEHLIYEMTNE